MCSLSKGNILLTLSSNEFLQFFLSWFSLILLCNFAFTLPGGTIWHSDISLIRTEYYFQSRPKIVFSHKPTRLRQFMSHQHVIECNIHPIWTTFGWKSAANLKLTAHVVQHMFWLMSSIIIKLVNTYVPSPQLHSSFISFVERMYDDDSRLLWSLIAALTRETERCKRAERFGPQSVCRTRLFHS